MKLKKALLSTVFEFIVEANEDQLFWKSAQKREEIGASYEAVYYSNVKSSAAFKHVPYYYS